jgi:hypothetical protein
LSDGGGDRWRYPHGVWAEMFDLGGAASGDYDPDGLCLEILVFAVADQSRCVSDWVFAQSIVAGGAAIGLVWCWFNVVPGGLVESWGNRPDGTILSFDRAPKQDLRLFPEKIGYHKSVFRLHVRIAPGALNAVSQTLRKVQTFAHDEKLFMDLGMLRDEFPIEVYFMRHLE